MLANIFSITPKHVYLEKSEKKYMERVGFVHSFIFQL